MVFIIVFQPNVDHHCNRDQTAAHLALNSNHMDTTLEVLIQFKQGKLKDPRFENTKSAANRAS